MFTQRQLKLFVTNNSLNDRNGHLNQQHPHLQSVWDHCWGDSNKYKYRGSPSFKTIKITLYLQLNLIFVYTMELAKNEIAMLSIF